MKVALIAHDGKKASMVSFVMKRLEFFNRNNVEIVTTGTTGSTGAQGTTGAKERQDYKDLLVQLGRKELLDLQVHKGL